MGISERKKREKEQRRNAIIDAAERIFFSKGIENARMDEVAVEAELSKGTLYLYFKNKNELLHAIIERGLEVLLKRFKKAIAKEKVGIMKVSALGKAYYDFYKEQPNYYVAMLHQEPENPELETKEKESPILRCVELGDQLFQLMQEAVVAGIKDGSVRSDLEPMKLAIVIWGHTSGILSLMRAKKPLLESRFNIDSDEIIDYSHQLIASYLINQAAPQTEKK